MRKNFNIFIQYSSTYCIPFDSGMPVTSCSHRYQGLLSSITRLDDGLTTSPPTFERGLPIRSSACLFTKIITKKIAKNFNLVLKRLYILQKAKVGINFVALYLH